MEMQATPQKEHRWLEKLVGDWTSEAYRRRQSR